jgi:peptidoglycan hydrolase-like protein with peptidoglycan-binding domain
MMGCKGREVETLQSLLNDTEPPPNLDVDGKFGPKTDKAVRDFQRRNALRPDGIVGPLTAQDLGVVYLGKPAAPPLPTGARAEPRHTTQPPLEALAAAIVEGLKKITEAAKQDFLNSGASKPAIDQTIDDLENSVFQTAADQLLGNGSFKGLGLSSSSDADWAGLEARTVVTEYARNLALIAVRLQDQAHGKLSRTRTRIESIDDAAVQRVVERTVKGTIVGGLEGALWDMNAILSRSATP